MDDDDIGDSSSGTGTTFLLLTGHTPLHDGASGAWSDEDIEWLWDRAHELEFMRWAQEIIKTQPSA